MSIYNDKSISWKTLVRNYGQDKMVKINKENMAMWHAVMIQQFYDPLRHLRTKQSPYTQVKCSAEQCRTTEKHLLYKITPTESNPPAFSQVFIVYSFV